MGLDIVEMIMAVEERFGIAIPDEDAEKLSTPGKLTDYVWNRVRPSGNASANLPACITQLSFHALRLSWMRTLDLPRSEFRPEVQLSEITPSRNRRQIWTFLGKNVGAVCWPELEYPRPFKAILLIMPITLLVLIYTWMVKALHSTGLSAVLVGVSSSIGIVWLVSRITRPLKRSIPSEYVQVKDLTHFMVARNPHLFKGNMKEWTLEGVRCAVREVIIEQTRVHDFTDDSNFVKDLGLD